MPERICVIPRVSGVGGMVSFYHKFTAGAQARGVQVTSDPADGPYAALLVIGGTRQIAALAQARRRGARVVQRLDGLNWIHRVRPVSFRHSLRAELGNLLLASTRRYLAQRIVYQSEFSHAWWDRRFGRLHKPFSVVHNGVDLQVYAPGGERPAHLYRLLVVEGSLGGGYDTGLENAVRLAEGLAARGWPMEVKVVGEVAAGLRAAWVGRTSVPLRWTGLVPREQVPALDRSAHLLFSADVHPACPNSVIEALACGLPVVAFDTGSLAELVPPEAGFIGPYGSNSWKLEPPDVAGLVSGAEQVLQAWPAYSRAARARAESAFGLDRMVDRYLEVLLG
ncbi:MAG TPA: glycosyltransferase family 4 protein [Anaerolineales bacterium]|jgi:glycosyltransferase involved in cell wall biosynthesis